MFSCENGSGEQCASSEFYIAKICWAGIELNSSVLQISLTFQLYIKVKHIISKMQCERKSFDVFLYICANNLNIFCIIIAKAMTGLARAFWDF